MSLRLFPGPAHGRRNHVLVFAAGVALAACSNTAGEPNAVCDATHVQRAIVGGKPESTLLAVSSSQKRAIVGIALGGSASSRDASCTGVVVTPRLILTARHCLDRNGDGVWDQDSWITLGLPGGIAPGGAADRAWLHPELDVGLLEAQWLEKAEFAVEPIPPNSGALDDSWLSAPVELAGYGITERGEPAALMFAIEQVARIEDDHVVVDGKGLTGACVGDSGGPILGRADDARIRVLGVLDDGDPSCTGEDFYTRTDRLSDWPPFANVLTPGVTRNDAPCEALSTAGGCDRGRAVWCEDGVARVDDCKATGLACGWNGSLSGFRCVNPEEDPCLNSSALALRPR